MSARIDYSTAQDVIDLLIDSPATKSKNSSLCEEII